MRNVMGRVVSGMPWLGAGLVGVLACLPATAQVMAIEGQAERQTMIKLLKPLTVNIEDQTMADVVRYVSEVTGAEIEAMWIDDTESIGLDPEQRITLRVRNASALSVLERALEQAARIAAEPGSNTWQFSEYGSFEIGPKQRLNKSRRIKMYDINDLLFQVPDWDNAPEFDLNAVLQAGQQGGGGGGQSPFQQQQRGQGQDDRPTRQELADGVIDLITSLVETEQWEDNGGDGATIRFFQGHLLVNAPDYVHRGINGYHWWPSRLTQRVSTKGAQSVTLTSDALEKLRRERSIVDPTLRPAAPVRGEAKPSDRPSDKLPD